MDTTTATLDELTAERAKIETQMLETMHKAQGEIIAMQETIDVISREIATRVQNGQVGNAQTP